MFLGATIIAGFVFFVLNFLSSIWLDPGDQTNLGAFFEAVIKTAIFGVIFHYLHNWTARLFRWYRIDEPDRKHRLDNNPALSQVRAERTE